MPLPAWTISATSGARATALAQAAETEAPGFAELTGQAAENGDEHVLKFTEACLREHALRPDPRYPAAALAAQQRIRGTGGVPRAI